MVKTGKLTIGGTILIGLTDKKPEHWNGTLITGACLVIFDENMGTYIHCKRIPRMSVEMIDWVTIKTQRRSVNICLNKIDPASLNIDENEEMLCFSLDFKRYYEESLEWSHKYGYTKNGFSDFYNIIYKSVVKTEPEEEEGEEGYDTYEL